VLFVALLALLVFGIVAIFVSIPHANVIWFAVAQLIPPALQLLIQGAAAMRQISVRPLFAPREAQSTDWASARAEVWLAVYHGDERPSRASYVRAARSITFGPGVLKPSLR